MKRLASIDIGSNSMHLCVADILPTGEWKILEVLRSSIQLGCYDPQNPGAMHPGRMNEAIEALLAFSARASLLQATSFSAAATAAVREASNQEEFQALFETELGFPLRVLSGVEEAAIVYRGTYRYLCDSVLLFDLGGRSTELIWGSSPEPEVCLSLPIGHLSLKEIVPYEHPCDPPQWQQLCEASAAPFTDIRDFTQSPAQLVSPSGSVRTLARMAAFARGDAPDGRGEGLSIDIHELHSLVGLLRDTAELQLGNIPGIDSRRASTLLASASVVQALMQRFSQDVVLAAPGGLREGLIQEWADVEKER